MLSMYTSERGFPTPMTNFFEGVEQGVTEIQELYVEFKSKPTKHWDFVKRAVGVARNAFTVPTASQPGLIGWIDFQLKNKTSRMGYLHYQFIIETIKFIRTGYRRVSPVTAIAMFDNLPHADKSSHAHVDNFRKVKDELAALMKTITQEENDHFISMWLTQDGGIMDLVYTLNVLYGCAEDPIINPHYFTTPDGVAKY